MLCQLQQNIEGEIAAFPAITEGADTVFAEAALALNIPLEVVIPFEQYAADFPFGPQLTPFEQLLDLAQAVHVLPYQERSDDAYLAGGVWLVDHSDSLLAVWEEQPACGKGGTGDIVQYARSRGLPIFFINPGSLSIRTDPN